MGFNLGNAFKYIYRCDLKDDAIEDLEKAIWYLRDEIKKRRGETKKPLTDSAEAPGGVPITVTRKVGQTDAQAMSQAIQEHRSCMREEARKSGV